VKARPKCGLIDWTCGDTNTRALNRTSDIGELTLFCFDLLRLLVNYRVEMSDEISRFEGDLVWYIY
jgi:hypothetical protein